MSPDEIEMELKRIHQIKAVHTVYWYLKANILIQHLMYRSCNKCIHFHYKIIDLHTEDNEIITKLTQQIKNQNMIFDFFLFRNGIFHGFC